jgi:regulator of nucleoside diphosphate kinase
MGGIKMNPLPDVTITSDDRERLLSLATAALPSRRDGVAASMLLGEIGRATIVPAESLPPNVVGMDCDVDIRNNITNTTEHLRIVFPSDQDGDGSTVSVLTPVGAALLGLSEGASIDWCTAAKDRKSLTVIRVHRRSAARRQA